MKTKNKIKIGILGENPVNDSKALCMLLSKRPYEEIQFVVALNNIEGDKLEENPKALGKRLNSKMAQNNLAYLICMRDLDATIHDENQVNKREEWFEQINKEISEKGILFLAVVAFEALILADIDRINTIFKLKLPKYNDPKFIPNPKKELKNQTAPSTKANKEYKQDMVCDIIEKIDFETIYKNHKGERSFQAFAKELIAKNILDKKKIKTPQ